MSVYNPFDDAHRLRDPFADTQRLSRGAVTAASSRTDLLRTTPGPDLDKEFFPDLNRYTRSFNQPEERRSTFSRIIRKGWLLALLALTLLGLCVALPLAIRFNKSSSPSNLSTTNAPPPNMSIPTLIDADTPSDVRESTSHADGSPYVLVFSDEFNVDGRTFYPGDDPYWEAVDLHYWQTGNLEWYDPAAITTSNGALEITLSKMPVHGLQYQGGMMTTWNKFCFTGGRVETNVVLPGANNVMGLWPAVWTMGNLGRAGYGASLEGMWPYTYDSCDVGTLPNQTLNGAPAAALTGGDPAQNGVLSFLPGQRLSRCTCTGEDHPGPLHDDGSYVGRSAPEIDVLEALVTTTGGEVSQSGQWAPFNAGYRWLNDSANYDITNQSETQLNSYLGGVFQQAISAVSLTNQGCYELETGCFSVYGFEYKPGFDDAYVTWINDNQVAWTLKSGGVAADSQVGISARPVPQEPMYLIINLGISENFGFIDIDHLTFPTKMRLDWIRVYQPADVVNIGCDPAGFPTADYIERHIEAYTNPNLTTWVDDFKQPFPKNKLIDTC